jgi:hypothetical protein
LNFWALDTHFNNGKLMLGADGWMRQYHPIIHAWITNYLEQIR